MRAPRNGPFLFGGFSGVAGVAHLNLPRQPQKLLGGCVGRIGPSTGRTTTTHDVPPGVVPLPMLDIEASVVPEVGAF